MKDSGFRRLRQCHRNRAERNTNPKPKAEAHDPGIMEAASREPEAKQFLQVVDSSVNRYSISYFRIQSSPIPEPKVLKLKSKLKLLTGATGRVA